MTAKLFERSKTVKFVTVATYGVAGSSARVRIHDWTKFLGIDAVHHDYLGGGNNSLGSMIRGLPRLAHAETSLRRLANSVSDSTVVISREASPFSNGALEASLLAGSQHGIYDFDDALFDTPAKFPKSLWSKASVWTAAVTNADTVIAGNDYLAERASQIRSDIVVIPSCVDPADYVEKKEFSLNEVPTLVWMGSPATEAYLSDIAKPLLRINAEKKIRLRVISAGNRSLGELDQIVERVNWSACTFGADLAHADVGLMPLDDSLYARGKCAYKLLQYGAAGLPVVGTPVGANRGLLEAMGGHSATSGQEWEQTLRDLLLATDSERAALGKQCRYVVSTGYSFARWSEDWQKATGLFR